MKPITQRIMLAVAVTGLWSLDMTPDYRPVLAASAEAVVGRPATPVSVAGVARRSTRRAVYATNASQQQQAAQPQQAAQQQQAAQPASAGALPKGTVVSALPEGCDSVTVDGVSLFNCGGTMFQPKFQSNNLVYVVL